MVSTLIFILFNVISKINVKKEFQNQIVFPCFFFSFLAKLWIDTLLGIEWNGVPNSVIINKLQYDITIE